MISITSHWYLAGFIAVGLFYLACGVFCASWNPWRLVEGFDRCTSTSKAQFFIWTVAALFGYTSFFIAWLHQSLTIKEPIPHFPEMAPWLASAMGLSGSTAIAAKGITTEYVKKGRITKPPDMKGGLLLDDTGFPELVKIQLLAWTVIAIGVFLAKLALQIRRQDFSAFPDVDGTLLALLGIGQGTYVGKKLVSRDP